MATAAITAEYVADAADVRAELAENGHSLSFGTGGTRTEGGGSLSGYTELGTPNVFPVKLQDSNWSGDVKPSDEGYLVDDQIDVRTCTHMRKADGSVYQICEIIEVFEPDGSTIIYQEVLTRKQVWA